LNTRYETERDLHDLHEPMGQDREISLGTTTILGIFFALALICAVFFGFGYSLGRRSSLPVAAPTEATTGSESNTSKPSSGSTASQISAKQSAGAPQSEAVPLDSSPAASEEQQVTPALVKTTASTPRSELPLDPPAKPPARTVPVTSATPSSGSSVVQVAAMSHQEDADVVAADLKRRGYTVAIRREPQDKLFHVQIGSFGSKKEADSMRQRLQADGYNNAIVK
jgi:DedD protein